MARKAARNINRAIGQSALSSSQLPLQPGGEEDDKVNNLLGAGAYST